MAEYRQSSTALLPRILLRGSERIPALLSDPTGGLAAVIYTDALQTLIMLIGAISLMVFSECSSLLSFTAALALQTHWVITNVYMIGVLRTAFYIFSWRNTCSYSLLKSNNLTVVLKW